MMYVVGVKDWMYAAKFLLRTSMLLNSALVLPQLSLNCLMKLQI